MKKKSVAAAVLVLLLAVCTVYTVKSGGEISPVNTEKITAGGTYSYTGNMTGRIKVNAPGEEVTILLAGVCITNTEGSCIKVEEASSVTILTEADTDNYLYAGRKDNPRGSGSCVNSYADLTIDGEGRLYVYGYDNNGIHAQENLTILGSSLYVESCGDGIQADDSMNILGGYFSIAAGDDAIHAENDLVIEDAEINITKSEEGIEANHITVNSGDISVTANDDGFNANGGSSGPGFGRVFDWNGQGADSGTLPGLTINGGSICVSAKGDGLDSNGDLIINGGTIEVDGPSNSANGALDSGTESGGKLLVNGGTLLAIGASGMAEVPDGESTQKYIYAGISFSCGDTVTITRADGTTLFTHTAGTSGNSIVYSSPLIAEAEEITVRVNDASVTVTEGESSGVRGFGGGPGHRRNSPPASSFGGSGS